MFNYACKGGYLDFSHVKELKNIYITELYMKKQYKSSIIKNHKITKEEKLEALERLYRSTGLIFLQWRKEVFNNYHSIPAF